MRSCGHKTVGTYSRNSAPPKQGVNLQSSFMAERRPRQPRRPTESPGFGGTDRGFHTRSARLQHERRQAIRNVSRIKRLFALGLTVAAKGKSPGPLDGNGRGFDAGSLVVDSLRSRRGYPYTGTLTKGSSLCVPLLESSFFFCLFGQPDRALSHSQHERLVAGIVRVLPRSAADRHVFGAAAEYLGIWICNRRRECSRRAQSGIALG
jgi:hypothetical protein